MGFPTKSSILIGFSIINHPFWGTPIFGNTHFEEKTPRLFIPFRNGEMFLEIDFHGFLGASDILSLPAPIDLNFGAEVPVRVGEVPLLALHGFTMENWSVT